MEKIFNDYKGVILFYVVVIALSLLFTMRINNLNEVANNETTKVVEHFYA